MISEERFKAVLDFLWKVLHHTNAMVNGLGEIGLDVNPGESNDHLTLFGGLYHMQTAGTELLFDVLGVEKKFESASHPGNTYSGMLEELNEFLFNANIEYHTVEDHFPEEAYDGLLRIFTSAGVVLPWRESNTGMVIRTENTLYHRGIVMSNYKVVIGYVFLQDGHFYIAPKGYPVHYDEEHKRFDGFALEVFSSPIAASLGIKDENRCLLFDGDIVKLDGEEITLRMSEPEVLSRVIHCQEKGGKIELVRYGYQDFLAENGR